MLKNLFCVLIIYFCATGVSAKELDGLLKKSLVRVGFENVRVKELDNKTYISLEDNLSRWYVDGMIEAIHTIGPFANGLPVSLIILNKGIPYIRLELEFETDHEKKSKANLISVSYDVEQSWVILKNEVPENRPNYKIDVVFYPQLALKNTNFDHLYHVMIDLSPSIETSLWKGMLLSGQLIFPVRGGFIPEENFIRPGFVTLSQEFKAKNNWFGRATIGNFNSWRYGADVSFKHPFGDSNWSMTLQTGYTGSSHFINGQWITGKLNTLTWSAGTGYFYPRFNLQMNLAYSSYLNNDHAVRADCTRHVGSVSIGFYAIYGDGPVNGGFHFSIPLGLNKYERKHDVRVMPAKYFDLEYNAETEMQYYQYYETRPNENRSEQWFNPFYIKNQILKRIQK